MFVVGDKIKVRNDVPLMPEVRAMVSGKVGVVTDTEPDEFLWDYVVQFEGTGRPGGKFGMLESDLKRA